MSFCLLEVNTAYFKSSPKFCNNTVQTGIKHSHIEQEEPTSQIN